MPILQHQPDVHLPPRTHISRRLACPASNSGDARPEALSYPLTLPLDHQRRQGVEQPGSTFWFAKYRREVSILQGTGLRAFSNLKLQFSTFRTRVVSLKPNRQTNTSLLLSCHRAEPNQALDIGALREHVSKCRFYILDYSRRGFIFLLELACAARAPCA